MIFTAVTKIFFFNKFNSISRQKKCQTHKQGTELLTIEYKPQTMIQFTYSDETV